MNVITDYAPPPAEYAKAVAYSQAQHLHYFVGALYGFLVLLLILGLRLAPRYRSWAESVSPRRFVQTIVFAPLLLATWMLLGMPIEAWDQALDRRFGVSVQGWGSWLGDQAIDLVLGLVLGSLLVWLLYAVIRRTGRRWWVWFWLASIPVILAVFFLQPLVIEPLFYKFTPLSAGQPVLVGEIQKVMHRGGIDIAPDRMFQMNASSRLTGLNAYVAGFGASKRVVVWDTTLAKATIPETLFVFGHEMGHYTLLHIPKEIAIFAAILLVLLGAGALLARWMLARWGETWGLRGLDDPASLPVILLVMTGLAFLATPAFNSVSRYFEHEADRYGLEVVHGIVPDENQVAARYFEKSGEINLSDPNPSPFVEAWFFDHPTRTQRVRFVATYDPWSHGESPRYVR